MLNLAACLKQNKVILANAKFASEKLKIKTSAAVFKKRSKVCGSKGELKT